MLAFGLSVILLLVVVVMPFLPDNQTRGFIAFVCLLAGGSGIALMYALLRAHEKLGDYLEIDRTQGTIHLPRQGRKFPLSDVVGFQWTIGLAESDYCDDLYLLVEESSNTVRYPIMGSPSREIVEEVASFSGMPVDEIRVSWDPRSWFG